MEPEEFAEQEKVVAEKMREEKYQESVCPSAPLQVNQLITTIFPASRRESF